LDENGSGSDADVARGVEWVVGHVRRNGWPSVINMSLGGGKSRKIDDVMCKAIAAGVTPVVAAGNDGRDACDDSPARVREVITVGASDMTDQRSVFSNYGECVDIFAPGAKIRSAGVGGGSRTLSGTSMASPHVAGVAALCLERRPVSSPAQVRACVLDNATNGRLGNVGDLSPNRLLYSRVR
jgi:subtilisin family serine protease